MRPKRTRFTRVFCALVICTGASSIAIWVPGLTRSSCRATVAYLAVVSEDPNDNNYHDYDPTPTPVPVPPIQLIIIFLVYHLFSGKTWINRQH